MPPRIQIRPPGSYAGLKFAAHCPKRRVFSATAEPEQPLRKRVVVGSYLFRRHDDGTPRVALFKRSGEVNTYQHKYAAVSGGIETEDANPLAAALREIHEETSLTSKDLQLLCRGEPWSFVDLSSKYEWSVHPFAFYFPSDADHLLKLGFEHEGHAWFKPQDIQEAETAAGVLASLNRVWPEGDLGDIDVLCRYFLGEMIDGLDARLDVRAAFDVFVKASSAIEAKDASEWWRKIRLVAWHVWNCSDRGIRDALMDRLSTSLSFLQILRAPQYETDAEFREMATAMLYDVQRLVDTEGSIISKDSDPSAESMFQDLWKTSV